VATNEEKVIPSGWVSLDTLPNGKALGDVITTGSSRLEGRIKTIYLTGKGSFSVVIDLLNEADIVANGNKVERSTTVRCCVICNRSIATRYYKSAVESQRIDDSDWTTWTHATCAKREALLAEETDDEL